MILDILIIILVLSFLVIIHEAGHFLAAKWAGVDVEEFGLGYPPRLFKLFKYKETVFSLNAIPFGGFVKLSGEEVDEDSPQFIKAEEVDRKKVAPFYSKTPFLRLVVILAGVAINLLFGILAFILFFSIKGIPTMINQPIIANVIPDSPAFVAGLEANYLVSGFRLVNGEVVLVDSTEKIRSFSQSHQGQEVVMLLQGPCQEDVCPENLIEKKIRIRTVEESPTKDSLIGIEFQQKIDFIRYPFHTQVIKSIEEGFRQALFLSLMIVRLFADMIMQFLSLKLPSEVSGPVGIVHEVNKTGLFKQGFEMILYFAGMISINLGVFNALPIPALDGGRAALILAEKLVGRKKVARIENYVNYAGFVFLVGLIILITARDIYRIIV